MIILLHGQDKIRSRDKLNELISRYKNKTSGSNFLFSEPNEKKDTETIIEFLKSNSIFSEEKLLVIKNAFLSESVLFPPILTSSRPAPPETGVGRNGTRSGSERVLPWDRIAQDKETVVIFFEETEIPRKKYEILPSEIQVLNFSQLKGRALDDWIIKEAKKIGGKFDYQLARFLRERLRDDMAAIRNELTKIIAFSSCPNREDIEKISINNAEEIVFKMIDDAIEGRYANAVRLLRKKIDQGESPHSLFALLSGAIRNLILLKEPVSSPVKLHPYVIKKTSLQARNFDLQELKHLYNLTVDLEIKMKKAGLAPATALEFLMMLLSEVRNRL